MWLSSKRQRLLKRAIDVLGASAGLIGGAPLFAATATAIWGTMGRPIFFVQERPGLHGETFKILKFRTMRQPKEGERWFRTDQVRITKLGSFLRWASIDELPELVNVLKGEMSLVGPRPLLVEYLPKYTSEEARRHDVLPGITGWAQVNGRQAISFSQRFALDTWYVDNWSLALDLKILGLTALQAVRGSGVISGQDVDEVDDLGLSSDRERVFLNPEPTT